MQCCSFRTLARALPLVTAILLALVLASCGPPAAHPAADQVRVAWGVLSHGAQGGFDSELIIRNAGSIAIPAQNWSLYFTYGLPVVEGSVSEGVAIDHINGDFYRLRPDAGFEPVAGGASLRVTFRTAGSAINVSSGPDGFYFVWDEAGGAEVSGLGDPEILPFEREEQVRRSSKDLLPVATPERTFQANSGLHEVRDSPLIIPRPRSFRVAGGTFTITRDVGVTYEGDLRAEADYLADALQEATGARPEVRSGAAPAAGTIHLGVDSVPGGEEAYRLTIDSGIRIVGSGAPGVFHGIQSLRALLPVTVFGVPAGSIDVPRVSVADAPRFPFRGLMLDVARNFQPAQDVKHVIDLMAFYKLNKLHLHLSDDEGWRIAIEPLPELTTVGGRRGHTLTEREHLQPSLGSGPSPDGSRGSGHFTRRDFVDLIRYAAGRHIEVIPEVDTPGHMRAAIFSMKARARRTGSDEYLLTHPADRSSYQSAQMYRDNVADVCLPSTYQFLETVVADLVAMYAEAGVPLRSVHTGGDEVPAGVWAGSPACTELIASHSGVREVADLRDYFTGRFHEILELHGLRMGGWEEIGLRRVEGGGYEPNPAFASDRIRLNAWSAARGRGGEDLARSLANAGYDVVISDASHFYLDFSHEKHPEEPGLYWGGFVSTSAPFAFSPLARHSLGLQGQLWSEKVRTSERMQYMLFPRLIALAERAWAQPAAWESMEDAGSRRSALAADWNGFANALARRELPRLDHLHGGVRYRLPPPGAVIEKGKLRANVELPGFTIRWTTDGSEPTATSPAYTGPVAVGGTVRLKTFNSTGRGSRTVSVSP